MASGFRFRYRAVAVSAALALVALAAATALLQWAPAPAAPGLGIATSTLVLDRHDRLLRAFTVADGRWRLPVELEDVDPRFIALLIAVEDRRFRDHPGVDPLALARAGWQLVRHGRIISGGSTITMQVARLLAGGDTRSVPGKLRQIRTALALERAHTKDEILAAYLKLAPYGGNLEGVGAGALAWFGKEPGRLSAAEAALLVALPQAPEARRPDRDPAAARRARDRVLERALALGVIDTVTARAARREPVPTRRRDFPLLAPHLAERLVRAHPERSLHRVTLDAQVQERLERLAAERAAALGERVSVAVLVADHAAGEVLAEVGSAGLLDPARAGFVDMTRAVRSPGSTLKPLIYGLAFEGGIAHPESLIEDRPTAFAGYAPANFDRGFQGTVTVRRALALSLNVPAVQLLDAVGPARLIARMRRAGAEPALPDAAPPGLAVGLGGVGVTLVDLVRIYGALARGGTLMPLIETRDVAPAGAAHPAPRVLDERAAWYLTGILASAPTAAGSAADGIAFKTGTSYGYRDAWAIGYDGRRLAAVWVGRADGASVPGLTGSEAAVPVLLDVFARLGPRAPLRAPPPGVLTGTTAALPPTLRHARVRGADPRPSAPGPEIAFPPDRARVEVGAGAGGVLVLKVRHGEPPFTWLADGRPIRREPFARSTSWTPEGPGYATLSVVDGRGRASRVTVYLD